MKKNIMKKKAQVLIVVFIMFLVVNHCKKALYAPAEGDSIVIAALPLEISPGGTSVITVTGMKSNGQPMPANTLVQLMADSGSFTDSGGTRVEAVRLIGGTGSAIYQADASFSGGVVTITAQSGAAVITPEALTITILDTDISQLFVTAEPLSLPLEGGSTEVTVTAYDSQQEVVAGKKIFLETTAGTLTPESPIFTDAQGKATATLTTTEAATITATYKEVVKTLDIGLSANAVPVAAFEFSPQNPLSGETIYFVSTSSDSDGSITDYLWNFGDGTTSEEANPVHHFPHVSEAKEFQVVLTVTDDDGQQASVAQTVPFAVVDNEAPVAAFVFSPEAPNNGDTIVFNASTSSDADGTIKDYKWDFGDGNSQEGSDPVVSYNYGTLSETTTFNVTLTVTDDGGAENSTAQAVPINVSNSPPTARFTFNRKNPNSGQVVTFTAENSSDEDGYIVSYEWSFGDGATGVGAKITHTFTVDTATTFAVVLTVTDDDGATGIITKEISVNP